MKILSLLRKPYLAIFLAGLVLFVSCNQYENNNGLVSEDLKFDFSLFQKNKGKLINMSSFKIDSKTSVSRLEINNIILDEINNELGTDLNYSDSFKSLELSSYENVVNYVTSNNLADETDLLILNDLNLNLNSLELSEAINLLEEEVINNAKLDTFKKEKFEQLANLVQLIEDETPGFFTSTAEQRSCLGAVIGLVFAFAGLVAGCNPASAAVTVGIACYLAAANYIRASITVGLECGDD